MQLFPSSQGPLAGAPGWHDPPPHASPDVQTLPSLQGAALFVCWHPDAGAQVSSVQGLPSLQPGGGPPAQTPPAHVSFVVQALPSSHAAVLAAWTQPRIVSHASSVHGLLSLQPSGPPPMHAPA